MESALNLNIWKRVTGSSALCALALVAAACGASDIESSGVPGANETAEVASAGGLDGPSAVGDLEFGATMDDLLDGNAGDGPAAAALPGFRSIEWEDLIPEGFSTQEVVARYKDQLDAAEPGSPEIDAIYEEMTAEFDQVSVNPELDSEQVQLAGFVAPLTYDGDNVTEFLLVPYFGACIHVPAPPVNQTVMVTLADGASLTLEESWGAVWVAGEMTATSIETDLATAGYTISGAKFGVHDSQ